MREPAIEDSHEGLHRTELACARECRKSTHPRRGQAQERKPTHIESAFSVVVLGLSSCSVFVVDCRFHLVS